jgi:hypothetical protein
MPVLGWGVAFVTAVGDAGTSEVAVGVTRDSMVRICPTKILSPASSGFSFRISSIDIWNFSAIPLRVSPAFTRYRPVVLDLPQEYQQFASLLL